MSWPSTIATLTNPQASDRLNAPSHSAIEQAQNTNIGEIETFVGTLSSVPGTLMYDIRSANSDGGGHVQTAAKGGTGQTNYSKGDLLVGQSSSVLTKTAIGNDGQVLSANSSVATGVAWINATNPKINVNSSLLVADGAGVTSMMTVTVPGSTLGSNNAIRGTMYISRWDASASVLVNAFYGGGQVASVRVLGQSPLNFNGTITYTLIAQNSSTQSGFLNVQLNPTTPVVGSVYGAASFGFASIASDAPQVLSIMLSGGAGNGITVNGVVVEKIS